VGAEPFRKIGQARFGGRPPRVGYATDRRRLLGQAAVRVKDRDGIELPARGADRPLEVRRLGVEHPVELAAEGTRYLSSLDLEEGARGTETAEERPDRIPTLGRHDPSASPDTRGRRQPEGGEARHELRRLSRLDHEFEVRPPSGEAQRPDGEEAAAKPGRSAVVGGRCPVEWRHRRRRRRSSRDSSKPDGQPRDGCSPAHRNRPKTRCLGEAITRARWIDGCQFVPERGHQVPFDSAHSIGAVVMPYERPTAA
jgi:hypothetical protein